MKVLIACEESATVREAFAKRGHDAWSCDLKPTRVPGNHIQDDVLNHLEGWDAILAFPDCTYLTVTANKWLKDQPSRKSGALVGEARREARREAVKFFMRMIDAPCGKIATENPIGCMSTLYRKPDQIIQPWQFGHAETKATCLWLKGLPKLIPTKIVEPVFWRAGGKKYSPTHYNSKASMRSRNRLDYLPPGADRSKFRSETYQGIADAMAEQWGSL